MALPVWFKKDWEILVKETIPAMQAQIADLERRLSEMETQQRYGSGYSGGYESGTIGR